MMKLVLGACVLYKEAEDSDPQQARYTVGGQLMFVDERMNEAKNWKGLRSTGTGIKNSNSCRGVSHESWLFKKIL